MMMGVFLGAVKALAEGGLGAADLLVAAEQLAAGGQPDLAVQLYQLWIGANPGSPALHAVCFNAGVVAAAGGNLAAARAAYERGIAANPDFLPSYINLGGVLERQGAVAEAVIRWQAAVERLSAVTGSAARLKTMALRQLGRVVDTHGRAAAEDALRQILELDPREGDVGEHFVALRLLQCKWPVMEPPEGVSRETLLRSMHPLSAAAYTAHPLFILALNWTYNRNRIGYKAPLAELPAPAEAGPKPKSKSKRIRVGYLSSDLCAHAVGYLMVEAMELHDKDKVEVFVYYCGPAAIDWINARTKAVTDCWVDINGMDDEAAARRIQEDGIEILVDLNGNTKGARTGICAMRPAPVIVNWLGFPGTMASPYHHYIIADDWIIPEEHEVYVTEKVLRLPCYQPNDRKRQVSAVRPSRQDAGLPEGAMVYCCFNWTQKISRGIFELWMSILGQVPNSVLWLLDTDKDTNRYLATLAAGYGIDPARLVFGKWMSSPDHLARYPLADLFLDTYPYGAHTTASDALWMGVPILTLSGHSFASRVCGSLARAAGVPDLVCSTPEEYVARAVELGKDPEQVRRYKQQLEANRHSCTLFDTDRLVRSLEALYGGMRTAWHQGRLPRPDLANLDVYLEVAIGEELEAIGQAGAANHREQFREKLARRHQACPIPEDRRLWTAAAG